MCRYRVCVWREREREIAGACVELESVCSERKRDYEYNDRDRE